MSKLLTAFVLVIMTSVVWAATALNDPDDFNNQYHPGTHVYH